MITDVTMDICHAGTSDSSKVCNRSCKRVCVRCEGMERIRAVGIIINNLLPTWNLRKHWTWNVPRMCYYYPL